jgi:8-oxo-dGTP pyrophosphatase MutT (NUDIX family)
MQYTKYYDYIQENDDYEDELDNHDTLNASGFWGKSVGNKIMAAGCIFIAMSTGRILLGHRSNSVLEPGTWGGFGGASKKDDNGELEAPIETVRREAGEEVGHSNVNKVIKFEPSYVYKTKTKNGMTFEYHNFLAFVKNEFLPDLNWENSEADWVEYGDWPDPLHFGFADLIDVAGIKIEKIIKGIKSKSALNEAKYKSYELDLVKAYELFKQSYEKSTGQAWTFDKFAGRITSTF